MTRRPRKLARAPEYVPIPQAVLDAGWRNAVHVEFWPASYRFHYRGTDSTGLHTVASSRGEYRTRNALLYTKRHTPNP